MIRGLKGFLINNEIIMMSYFHCQGKSQKSFKSYQIESIWVWNVFDSTNKMKSLFLAWGICVDYLFFVFLTFQCRAGQCVADWPLTMCSMKRRDGRWHHCFLGGQTIFSPLSLIVAAAHSVFSYYLLIFPYKCTASAMPFCSVLCKGRELQRS